MDKASPYAIVEDSFFQKGIEAEKAPDNPDLWSPALPEKDRRGGLGIVARVAGAGCLILAGVMFWQVSITRKPASKEMPQTAAVAVVAAAPRAPVAQPAVTAPPVAMPVPVPAPPATAIAVIAAPPAPPTRPILALAKARPAEVAAQSENPLDESASYLIKSCNIAYKKQSFKEVLHVCKWALEANPGAANVAVMLAHAETSRGHAGQAVSWAKRAIAIDASSADAYVYLGSGEQELGHKIEARAAYEKYLALAPRGPHAADLRAIIDSL